MTKANRLRTALAAAALWTVATAITVAAFLHGSGMSEWHVLQLPVTGAAVCMTVIAALGRVIAPTRASFELGYDAGLRDGLQAASAPSPVIHLESRKPSRRRTDVPTG